MSYPKTTRPPLILCGDGEERAVTVARRVRFVRCGKLGCRKCQEGEGHGPYIYETYRAGNTVRTDYDGRADQAGR